MMTCLAGLRAWRVRWADRVELLGRSASPAVHRAERIALTQGFVLTVGQARAAGITSAQARSLVRLRQWFSPRRATLGIVNVGTDALGRAALAASAAALVRGGSVVSHESAAVLLGLP